jgi:hypothetical protein
LTGSKRALGPNVFQRGSDVCKGVPKLPKPTPSKGSPSLSLRKPLRAARRESPSERWGVRLPRTQAAESGCPGGRLPVSLCRFGNYRLGQVSVNPK